MGFRIEIPPEASLVIKGLKSNPAAVFKRPFPGYLLFLFENVSASEKRLHDWMIKKSKDLDQLSGGHFAFAVFAETLQVKVRPGDGARRPWNREKEPPVIRAEFDPTDQTDDDGDYHIERLVKSGLFGMVHDETTIETFNKATRQLAEAFKVTGHLPCVVAMDGFPCSSEVPFKVFELKDIDMDDFYVAVRKAVGMMQNHPGCDRYRELLQNLHRRKEEVDAFEKVFSADRGDGEKGKALFGQALKQGDRDQVAEILRPLAEITKADSDWDRFLTEECEWMSRLHSLFSKLSGWKGWLWPLVGEQRRSVEDLIAAEWDFLSSVTDQKGFSDDVFELESEWRQWFQRFASDRSRLVRECHARIEERLGADRLTEAFSQFGSTELLRKKLELEKAVAEDIRALAEWGERPSWMAMLEFCLFGGAAPRPAEKSFLADWLLGEASTEYLKACYRGEGQRFHDDMTARHGVKALSRPPSVFVSYSSKDEEEVKRLMPVLRVGVGEVFRDNESMVPGEEFNERIVQEIKGKDIFCLFWSKNAADSPYVEKEWSLAVELNKAIQPVVIAKPYPPFPPQLGERFHFGGR